MHVCNVNEVRLKQPPETHMRESKINPRMQRDVNGSVEQQSCGYNIMGDGTRTQRESAHVWRGGKAAQEPDIPGTVEGWQVTVIQSMHWVPRQQGGQTKNMTLMPTIVCQICHVKEPIRQPFRLMARHFLIDVSNLVNKMQ